MQQSNSVFIVIDKLHDNKNTVISALPNTLDHSPKYHQIQQHISRTTAYSDIKVMIVASSALLFSI